MEYIILAAGVGTRLYPYTKNTPKCLVRLSEKETIIERAIRLINANDSSAHVTVVVGFEADKIQSILSKNTNCSFIFNPFYAITNSVASLWFARDVLQKGEQVVVLNADIVFSRELAKLITTPKDQDVIYYDSSIHSNGDYNVLELNGEMVVMGKELEDYSGEYVGITHYTPQGARVLCNEIESMVEDGLYDQWYENGLVQLTLMKKSKYDVIDVSEYQWSEIDSIGNLLKITQIIQNDK